MLPLRRKSRRWIPFAAPLLGLLVVLQLLKGPQWFMFAGAVTRSSSSTSTGDSSTSRSTNSAVSSETPPNAKNFLCPPMPGIEDVLVVLKTGVTEALDKIPVHARTTFRCVPNYLVVSDFEEVIEGVQLHDVLTHVQDGVKANIEDFNLYNRLKIYGRKGLVEEDATEEENGVFGMPNNPGWKLDKWKFLPMIDEALKMKPTAKWFVFMEADTHIVWPNLVSWVAQLDHRQPHYLGTETQIGEVLFAHGGSGFILSQTAMRLASMQRKTFVDEYDEYTDMEWAGDMVLGKVLKDAGVDLTFTWPLLQNARLGEIEPLTNNFYRQPWCWPVVGFHHLSPEDVEQMWKFDQDWFIKRHHKYLLHSDVFRERLLPQMSAGIHKNWDNLAGDLVEDRSIDTVDACRKHCEKDGLCRQFSFRWDADPDREGKQRPECRTFESPRLGVPREGTQSGWMMTRIELTSRARGYCQWPEWE